MIRHEKEMKTDAKHLSVLTACEFSVPTGVRRNVELQAVHGGTVVVVEGIRQH